MWSLLLETHLVGSNWFSYQRTLSISLIYTMVLMGTIITMEGMEQEKRRWDLVEEISDRVTRVMMGVSFMGSKNIFIWSS